MTDSTPPGFGHEASTPPGVPAGATFDDDLELWASGEQDAEGQRTGTWSFWASSGILVEETDHQHGRPHGHSVTFWPNGKSQSEGDYLDGERVGLWRFWNENGSLVREGDYDAGLLSGTVKDFDGAGRLAREASYAAGRKNGSWYARLSPGLMSDPRIVAERGEFTSDFACGVWSYFDETERVLQNVDMGTPVLDTGALLETPVFRNGARAPGEWVELGQRLHAEHHTGEALCSHARAAATSGQVQELRSLLAELAPTLSPPTAVAAANHVLENCGESLPVLVNALARGADPAAICRAIARILDTHHRSHAALDFVNVALALTPDRREYYFTRALIHMSLGEDKAAIEDAHLLKPEEPVNAQFLLDYERILFPSFAFWPAQAAPETYYDNLPPGPGQSLDAVRATIQKYATRLQSLRSRLIEAAGDQHAWLPPDLSALLPSGPVPLQAWTFTLPGEEGGAGYEVHVDETLEPAGWGVPTVLKQARADWMALTWLCWAVGLSAVELPAEIKSPADYGVAVGMSAQRLWRCRDKVQAGGKGAQNQNAPAFQWEGLNIDDMNAHLARMAEAEYSEMQAMFYWLCDETSQSPWQDNLRGS